MPTQIAHLVSSRTMSQLSNSILNLQARLFNGDRNSLSSLIFLKIKLESLIRLVLVGRLFSWRHGLNLMLNQIRQIHFLQLALR